MLNVAPSNCLCVSCLSFRALDNGFTFLRRIRTGGGRGGGCAGDG